MYNFNISLEDSGNSDLPAKASVRLLDDDTKKLQDAAVKSNNLELTNITMAFTKKGLMLLVN